MKTLTTRFPLASLGLSEFEAAAGHLVTGSLHTVPFSLISMGDRQTNKSYCLS